MAARIVIRTCRREHMLHWSPVSYRIQYKNMLWTFKSLNGLAPSYLTDLLKPYQLPDSCAQLLSTSCPCMQHITPLLVTGLSRTLHQSYGMICHLLWGPAHSWKLLNTSEDSSVCMQAYLFAHANISTCFRFDIKSLFYNVMSCLVLQAAVVDGALYYY